MCFINENFFIFIAVFLFTAVAVFSLVLSGHNSRPCPTDYLSYIDAMVSFSLIFLAFTFIASLMRNLSCGYSGLKCSILHLKDNYLRLDRLFGLVFLLLIIPIFLNSYTILKTNANQIKPFEFDELFMNFDYILHAGNHPWQLLFPYLSERSSTVFIDRLYAQGWFLSWITIFIWAAWTTDRRVRWIFFSNFILAWILLGTFMAHTFPSAGPCYFHMVSSYPSPYLPLMENLWKISHETDLVAVNGQATLWRVYLGGLSVQGEGISAMPSMHISMMTTCTLGAYSLNRIVGYIYMVLTLLFLIGSIYLGWHYAIDGYVSIILTAFLWFLLSKVANKKFCDQPSTIPTVLHEQKRSQAAF